jgi:hypothetical protein
LYAVLDHAHASGSVDEDEHAGAGEALPVSDVQIYREGFRDGGAVITPGEEAVFPADHAEADAGIADALLNHRHLLGGEGHRVDVVEDDSGVVLKLVRLGRHAAGGSQVDVEALGLERVGEQGIVRHLCDKHAGTAEDGDEGARDIVADVLVLVSAQGEPVLIESGGGEAIREDDGRLPGRQLQRLLLDEHAIALETKAGGLVYRALHERAEAERLVGGLLGGSFEAGNECLARALGLEGNEVEGNVIGGGDFGSGDEVALGFVAVGHKDDAAAFAFGEGGTGEANGGAEVGSA